MADKRKTRFQMHYSSSSSIFHVSKEDRLYFSTILSAMNSFFFGLHTTSLEILKPVFSSNFQMDERMWSSVSSILFFGALIGNTVSLFLKINLKIYLIMTVILYGIGHSMIAFADSFIILFFGRVSIGVSAGFTCAVVPLYLSFLAPSKLKGFIGYAHQLMIALGIFIGQSLSFIFSSQDVIKIVYKTILIVYLVTLVLMTRIKNVRNVVSGPNKSIGQLIRNPASKNSLCLSIFLHAGQQLTGISAIYLFSNEILKKSISNEKLGTLSLGFTSVIFTLLSMSAIEKFGRKSLLIVSLIGISISLFFLSFELLPLIALYGFIGSFSIGMGPVTWLIINEMFPDDCKTAGNVIAVSTNWLAAFFVTFSFNYLFDFMKQKVFLIYAGLMIALCLFVSMRLIETKGRKDSFQ